MGRVRLTRAGRAAAGTLAGCAAVVAGTWLLAGLGVALILAGVLLAAYFVVLYDADEQPRRRHQ